MLYILYICIYARNRKLNLTMLLLQLQKKTPLPKKVNDTINTLLLFPDIIRLKIFLIMITSIFLTFISCEFLQISLYQWQIISIGSY